MEVVLISIGVSLLVISFLGVTLLVGFAIGLYYAKYYYDNSEKSGVRKWLAFQRFLSVKLIHYIKKYYFDYETVYMANFEPSDILDTRLKERVSHYLRATDGDTAIFAASPHGLFAISTFFLVATPDYFSKQGLQWKHVRPCIHRHVFAIPFLRDVALWFGAIDVSKENMERMLEKSSIILAPGGTREMIIDEKNPIQTMHKGFLRIAYEKKKPVFPILHMGQEKVFRSYSFRWLDCIRSVVLKYTGYPFPTLFLGPFPCKLTTYVFDSLFPMNYPSEESFIDAYYSNIISYHKRLLKA